MVTMISDLLTSYVLPLNWFPISFCTSTVWSFTDVTMYLSLDFSLDLSLYIWTISPTLTLVCGVCSFPLARYLADDLWLSSLCLYFCWIRCSSSTVIGSPEDMDLLVQASLAESSFFLTLLFMLFTACANTVSVIFPPNGWSLFNSACSSLTLVSAIGFLLTFFSIPSSIWRLYLARDSSFTKDLRLDAGSDLMTVLGPCCGRSLAIRTKIPSRSVEAFSFWMIVPSV